MSSTFPSGGKSNQGNRVQVDLKILQDRSLKTLQQFSVDFDKSVQSLISAMEGYQGQIDNASGRVTGGGRPGSGVNPNASVSTSPPIGIRDPGSSNPSYSGGGPGGKPENVPNVPAPSPARSGFWPNFQSQGFGPGNITEYERAGMSLGNIGGMGLPHQLRYLSHITQRAGTYQVQNPVSGENEYLPRGMSYQQNEDGTYSLAGNPSIFSNTMMTAGAALGLPGRADPYVQSAMGITNQIQGVGVGNAAFAANVGKGGNMLSQDWYSLKTKAEAFGTSLFNPWYTSAQAQQARQLTNQYGWSGGQATTLQNIMQNLTTEGGIRGVIPQSSMMELLDPAMRYGTGSLQQMVSVINSIPDAAKAANMSLAQFQQNLVDAVQQVAQNGLMTQQNATGALSSFTATTGIAPQTGANLLNDTNMMYMTMGLTHKNAYQVTYGNTSMADRMKVPMTVAQQIIGMPLSQLTKLNSNDPKFTAAMSRLTMFYSSPGGAEMLGGFNPQQILNMSARPDLLGRMAVEQEIPQIGTSMQIKNWNKVLTQADLTKTQKQDFWDNTDAYIKQNGKPTDAVQKSALQQAQAGYLKKALAGTLTNASNKAAATVTLTLDPYARKLLKFQDGVLTPKQNANSGPGGAGWFVRQIKNAADSIPISIPISVVPFG